MIRYDKNLHELDLPSHSQSKEDEEVDDKNWPVNGYVEHL